MDEANEKKKAEFTLLAEVKDADGKIVAVSKGVYQLRQIGSFGNTKTP
jgi:hypothetical protein